jgi:hypothetical protein
MPSRHLMWERTPQGGVLHVGEQIALAGRSGLQELLISKRVPGSTARSGRKGPQELLIGKNVPGSSALAGPRGPQELLFGTYQGAIVCSLSRTSPGGVSSHMRCRQSIPYKFKNLNMQKAKITP